MKKVILTATSIAAVALGSAMANENLASQIESQKNCAAVATVVKGVLSSKATTTEVASILDTAIKAKPECACEIVTAMIQATGAAAKDQQPMIELIVVASVTASPEQAPTIAECAITAAPNHSEAIENTLRRVLDKNLLGVSSKQGYGKDTYEEPEKIEDDTWAEGVSLPAPVYLIAPSGGIIGAGGRITPGDLRYGRARRND